LSAWIEQARHARAVPSFREALSCPGMSLIAEIKRASPSLGQIRSAADPARLAKAYEAGGARAISVLTEPLGFQGSLDDLLVVRAGSRLPLLRKDFLFTAGQVCEARLAGASAVLLIVRFLSDTELVELKEVAERVGLDVLAEIHDEQDLERATSWGFPVLGVNCRDLETMRVDLAVHERMARLLPKDSVTVAESGIGDVAGLLRARDQGYDAVLMGESLMRQVDPAAFLRELLGTDSP